VNCGGLVRIRLLQGLALLLIAGGIVVLLQRPRHSPLPPPEANPFRLLPDTGGSVREVACVVNSARRSQIRNAASITEIVNALPAATSINLLTNDRDAFELGHPDRVNFADLRADGDFTIWPQDPVLVLAPRDNRERGRLRLLVPARFERADDREIADAVARLLAAEIVESACLFEGGNIVSSESHIFIGENTIHASAAYLGEPLSRVARRFESELGGPVLVVGGSPQPVGHLDMMLTPLGDGRLLVADSGAGADLVSRLLAEDPSSVTAFEETCMAEFFGHPAVESVQGDGGKTMRPPDLRGQTAKAVAHCRELAAALDEVAASLAAAGFEVHRIPFFAGTPPVELPSDPDQTGPPRRNPGPAYPTLTYNNLLLNQPADRRATVFLPRYGLDALDDAAVETWAALGFEIIRVDDLHISAMYGGSLRCCTKVLRRGKRSLSE